MNEAISRRTFAASVVAGVAATSLDSSAAAAAEPAVGPMVGHVSTSDAVLWFRPPAPGPCTLVVKPVQGGAESRLVAEARRQHDLCVRWHVAGLRPATDYTYRIEFGDRVLSGDDLTFTTAPPDDAATKVTLAFGSCADSKPLELWNQIGASNVDGLVLLGDTPYIDSTDLAIARRKHRDFLRVPELSRLIRSTPTWGTWDDHDFGRNDSDGRLKGKENTRRAFVEYRANAAFGEQDAGIYTSFRHGPIEVFLLDTRWFARTEPSPVDPSKPTLLGKRQWEWLQRSLKASTAPFKMIACGMIWDDKRNTESDDWGTYAHERAAVFDFLGAERISGVVLVGGDIHCSRWLRYGTEQQVGYPIDQFIVSPIHDRTIPKLNVKHPDLVRGAAMPHVWLKVDVDATGETPTLRAEWRQMNGREMWSVERTASDLRPT